MLFSRLLTASICLVCFTSGASAGNSTVLKLASDPYCPYTCTPESEKPGYMVEFAEQALEPHGYKVDYSIMPWKRVLILASKGELDGAITVDTEDAKHNNMLVSKTPFASTCQSIITRKNDPFIWAPKHGLSDRQVVIINGYTYGGPVREWLADSNNENQIHKISGENALGISLKMIAKGRADATIVDCNVASFTASTYNLSGQLKTTQTGYGVRMFIGITRNRTDSEQINQILEKAFQQMKDDGRLEKLAAKYSISNWK